MPKIMPKLVRKTFIMQKLITVVPAQEKPPVVRLCEGGSRHQPGAVVPTLAAGLPSPSFSSPRFAAQVARLEQLLRGMYQKVLAARATQWDSLRADCVARMEELAEVFGGRQQLSRVVASKKLEVKEIIQSHPKGGAEILILSIGLVESPSPADGGTSVGRSISGCKDSCPAYTGRFQPEKIADHQ